MPVETAKIAPKAFIVRTRRERKDGIVKPERIVFSSGMPEPEAMYNVLPVTEEGEEVDGREDFVNMVAVELMIPKTNAIPT
jgi:hypothetical protein